MSRAVSRSFFVVAALALACAALLALPQQTHAVSNQGLVGYWSFNEGTGTQAGDFSGNGNTGTLSGSAWVDGKRGKALSFDDTDDYVDAGSGSPLNITGAITIALWVKKNSLSGFDDLIHKGDGPGDRVQYGVETNDDELLFTICTGTNASCVGDDGVTMITTDADLATGIWYHVVVTYDDAANDIVFYVNGMPKNESVFGGTSEAASMVSSTNAVRIGELYDGDPSDGIIDDVRIYNRALTAGEIAELYRAGAVLQKPPNNLGLVGYWSFNEGTSTQATDFSGNGNTGTLLGATLPTWVNGKRQKALNFDGSTSYVESSQSQTMTNDITLSAWIKTNTNTVQQSFIAQNVQGAGLEILATGELNFYVGDGSSNFNETGGNTGVYPAISTNVWHHIVGVFNDTANTMTVYLDGSEYDSDTGNNAHNIAATTFRVGIGSAWDGGGIPFDGAIDEVRIYNRALGATEIAALAQSGAVKFTTSSVGLQQGSTLMNGLVGHWTFDGPDITTNQVLDRSGSNNHGGFFGGATSSAKVIGKLGQALQFDGVNDSVIIDGVGDDVSSGPTSVAFWFKFSSRPTVTQDKPLFTMSNGDITILHSALGGNCFFGCSDRINAFVFGTPNVGLESDSSELVAGDWHHAVLTSSASQTNWYIDGVLNDSGAGVSRTFSGQAIVASSTDSGLPFTLHGLVDDVRVYNRALTAAEVKQLYNLGGAVIRQ